MRLANQLFTKYLVGRGVLDLLRFLGEGTNQEAQLNLNYNDNEERETNQMTPQEANAYMKEKMGFVPRMFSVVNQIAPPAGQTFADFYATIFGNGALPTKIKELMFMSTGVAYCSPRCIIHVVPAIEAGATDQEIFEAASVGMIAAGFVPNGPGIPYAFEYAAKCLDIAAKYRAGEEWEYLPAPKFNRGVY